MKTTKAPGLGSLAIAAVTGLLLIVSAQAEIKAVALVPVQGSGVFHFVRYLHDGAELVRFRDSGQLGELDLREPKKPTLKSASALSESVHSESLGQTGLVMINGHYRYVSGAAHDLNWVDFANPAYP